jgi:hypothetical protein
MILLNPEGSSDEKRQELAPRRYKSLDGMTLGLLGNSKLNADEVLAALGEFLAQRYAIKGIVHRKKTSFSHPAPPAIVDEMVEACDVVLAGVGD